MIRKSLLLLCGLLAWNATLLNLSAAEDPAHNQLRALRTEVIEAIAKGDIDAVLRHVHPTVVITWQNAEVCRGPQGLREFFNRMGKDAFKGYKVPPTPDDLTILHGGDTGVSFGQVVANYKLLGKDFEFKSRWTATLVKENDRWLLASYHVSMNALDNPILNAAKNGLYWAAGVAAIAGLLIGLLLGKRKRA
ncbi:MAG: nuclear transport factor 2 family protein [Opitutaceae bacterium]